MRLRCALFECCFASSSDALPELPKLDYTELANATHSFHPFKYLGTGRYGKVYHGVLGDRGEIAIQRCSRDQFCRMQERIQQEDSRHLKSLAPRKSGVRFWVRLWWAGGEFLLAHEYVPNGTLEHHLHGEGSERIMLPWHIRLDIAIDTANALAYLHSKGIIHGQVTPLNILLDENLCAKVKKILLSWQLPRGVSGFASHVTLIADDEVSWSWRNGYLEPEPESTRFFTFSLKSDVYSFGVVLCELLSSKPAMLWDPERGMHTSLRDSTVSKIEKHALEELFDPSLGFESDPGIKQMLTSVAVLAYQCLNDDPSLRPSMEQVLEGLKGIREGRRDLNLTADLERQALKLAFFQDYFRSQFRIFSYDVLAEATNNFENYLGKGGFGTVSYGNLPDGREVAIKRFHEKKDKTAQQFMREVEILSLIRHQNLVSLYGRSSDQSDELLLVYEYVSNGSLASYLHRNFGNQLPWVTRLNIAVETACALSYLHHCGIIHRDVKPSNILLDKNFGVKVADFGLARFLPSVASQGNPAFATHVSTAPVGTPAYIDPEYYESNKVSDKSDVYSYGVVLFQLISFMPSTIRQGPQLFTLANFAMGKIMNNELEELVDPSLGFDSDNRVIETIIAVAELAFQCVQHPKELRPSMKQVFRDLGGHKTRYLGIQPDNIVLISESTML